MENEGHKLVTVCLTMSSQSSSSLFQPWIDPEKDICSEGILYNHSPMLWKWLVEHVDSLREQHECDVTSILSRNPFAVPFLLRYPEFICEREIITNPNPWVLFLIQPTLDKIMTHGYNFQREKEREIYQLCRNENPLIIEWLETHVAVDHLNWYCLSSNPSAMDLLLRYPERIHWETFTSNPNPRAIQYIKEHPEGMSADVYAYQMIALHNYAPEAGEYLRSVGRNDLYALWQERFGTLENMDLTQLSNHSYVRMATNPRVIEFFKANPEFKHNLDFYLSQNPAIFRS